MHKERELDRVWYHQLGVAENIDHLIDDDLQDLVNQTERTRNINQCGKCGSETQLLRVGPEGQRVCPYCYDYLVAWYEEHTNDPCIACGDWSADDSELCGPCIGKYNSAEGYRRYRRNKSKYANVEPPGRRK